MVIIRCYKLSVSSGYTLFFRFFFFLFFFILSNIAFCLSEMVPFLVLSTFASFLSESVVVSGVAFVGFPVSIVFPVLASRLHQDGCFRGLCHKHFDSIRRLRRDRIQLVLCQARVHPLRQRVQELSLSRKSVTRV